jgi:hypothetical protein
MPDDNSTRLLPLTVGLYRLAEDLQLQIPLPATRSEIVAGARKTIAADGKVLEQYPKNYTKGLIGNLRFALRYEPIALDVYLAIVIDPKIHLTGPRRLVRRQRINDNLLGSGAYSPLVRGTHPNFCPVGRQFPAGDANCRSTLFHKD